MRDGWARKGAFFALLGLSALLAVYVVTAHVLAYGDRARADVRAYREGFAGSDTLPPGFVAEVGPGLSLTVSGGMVHITGQAHTGDTVIVRTPKRRFDDSVVAIRFRSSNDDAAEAFVGIEQRPGHDARVAYAFGPTPLVAFGGDLSGSFDTRQTSDETLLKATPAEWHQLGLQFSPRYASGAALLDGVPVASAPVGWPQGVEGRVIFGVRLRGDAHVDVELDALSVDGVADSLASFEDEFKGELLDPSRWIVTYPARNVGSLNLRVSRAGGLRLDARVTAIRGTAEHMYYVRTVPFPLRTFEATARIRVEELGDGRVYFGMMGSSAWAPPGRVFDVGMTDRNGARWLDAAGSWTATDALSTIIGDAVTLPYVMNVRVTYDAATAIGESYANGKLLARHVLDLKPLDPVSLRVGAGGFARGAGSRIVVEEVSVRMR